MTITARDVPEGPQFTVDVRNWSSGAAGASSFEAAEPTSEADVDFSKLRDDLLGLPSNYVAGGL
jgi:hypothetical protein